MVIIKRDGSRQSFHGEKILNGIKKACELLDIKWEDTYAFGDSENDLDMLKYAGVGIAMGNGVMAAKEAADYVTRPINEHGIYAGLKEFGLI